MVAMGTGKGPGMSQYLQTLFPGLRTAPFRITSPADLKYNCIAWAADDTSNWWWPHGDELTNRLAPKCRAGLDSRRLCRGFFYPWLRRRHRRIAGTRMGESCAFCRPSGRSDTCRPAVTIRPMDQQAGPGGGHRTRTASPGRRYLRCCGFDPEAAGRMTQSIEPKGVRHFGNSLPAVNRTRYTAASAAPHPVPLPGLFPPTRVQPASDRFLPCCTARLANWPGHRAGFSADAHTDRARSVENATSPTRPRLAALG